MKFIDLDLVLRDAQAQMLIETAEAVRGELRAAPDAASRRELMRTKRAAWADFRALFERTYGAKCWYTESKNPGTDDDIDHYRPQRSVAEAPDHDGYWWEAFNWENLRLSCHRANRRRSNPDTGTVLGKGDHFPLLDEAHRWCSPDSFCCEEPALLDPTDPEDPPHLTFDIDGRVAIAPAYARSDMAIRRVEASREFLHLDWPAFVDDRRDLYAVIYGHVLTGDRAEKAKLQGEAAAGETLKTVIRELIRLAGVDQPYSRAAAAYIRRFRDRTWIERVVLFYLPEIST
ncbi:hypothetical protein [Conexibacter sp. CPCC 206217]|uniref:hypothetical protein n=1 Tax=Conexibacter sp. CPCC 206217 TaxID=3064574 RepID=UPI00271F2376|nr:hypothetical protein [Conexibacter sp. CPCC 206217]MDO8210965.1 hypothetical protein [Conexibacter sp. CPCC 206217]